jgi:hypothetical protein
MSDENDKERASAPYDISDQMRATIMAQLRGAEKFAEDPEYAEASLQLTQAAIALMNE